MLSTISHGFIDRALKRVERASAIPQATASSAAGRARLSQQVQRARAGNQAFRGWHPSVQEAALAGRRPSMPCETLSASASLACVRSFEIRSVRQRRPENWREQGRNLRISACMQYPDADGARHIRCFRNADHMPLLATAPIAQAGSSGMLAVLRLALG